MTELGDSGCRPLSNREVEYDLWRSTERGVKDRLMLFMRSDCDDRISAFFSKGEKVVGHDCGLEEVCHAFHSNPTFTPCR